MHVLDIYYLFIHEDDLMLGDSLFLYLHYIWDGCL